MTPNTNDLVIRVRLDTAQANQEWKKQEDSAKKLGGSAGFGIGGALGMGAKGLAAGLQFIFGDSAAKSWGNINAVGSNIGRSTFLGQQIEKDTAKRNAWESARAQTAQMFGAVGNTASKEQIMSIFSALYGFEKREAMGRQRVESLVDQRQADQTMNDLKFFLTHFTDVMRELLHGFGAGRPSIR